MSTRLYMLPGAEADVSHSYDAGWSSTTQAKTRRLVAGKATAAAEILSGTLSGSAGNQQPTVQLVSPPLAAQTLSGTITIVCRGRELTGTDNIDRRVGKAYVVSSDGSTVRGTLLALTTFATAVELATTPQGVLFTSAAALTPVDAADGDRIVIEVGYRENGSGTTPQWEFVVGGSGVDHTTTNGDVTGSVPWVEFSADLTFQTAPDPLLAWQTRYAAAKAGTDLATVVVYGASTMEGAAATTFANRCMSKLAAALRTAAGLPAGGDGYKPAFYSQGIRGAFTTTPWINWATETGAVNQDGNWSGFGCRIVDGINSSGDGFDVTVHGTSLDVWYDKEPGAGSFSVSIDGGAATTIATAQASGEDLHFTHIAMGASGDHAVTVRWVSGSASVAGFTVYDGDETTGFRFIDCGHYGLTAEDHLRVSDGGLMVDETYESTCDAIDAMTPGLVLLDLGGNEFLNAAAAPDAFGTNLLKLVGSYQRRSAKPTVLILGHFPYDDSMGDDPTYTWSDYRDAMADAAAMAGTAFYDLSASMPIAGAAGDPTAGGVYTADGIHPTDAGHTQIATLLAAYLTPATPPPTELPPHVGLVNYHA